MKTIDIARDFARSPGGRDEGDGPASGARFRRELLVPALQTGEKVRVVLNGVSGFGSSFLDEAFGGLVREDGYEESELLNRLELVATDPGFAFYKERVLSYIANPWGE